MLAAARFGSDLELTGTALLDAEFRRQAAIVAVDLGLNVEQLAAERRSPTGGDADSRIATQAPIGIDELIKRAPTEFLAGVVAGAVYLKR